MKITLEYLDCFAAGWNLARVEDSFSYINDIVKRNRAFYMHQKSLSSKQRRIMIQTQQGMIDGWRARKSFMSNEFLT